MILNFKKEMKRSTEEQVRKLNSSSSYILVKNEVVCEARDRGNKAKNRTMKRPNTQDRNSKEVDKKLRISTDPIEGTCLQKQIFVDTSNDSIESNTLSKAKKKSEKLKPKAVGKGKSKKEDKENSRSLSKGQQNRSSSKRRKTSSNKLKVSIKSVADKTKVKSIISNKSKAGYFLSEGLISGKVCAKEERPATTVQKLFPKKNSKTPQTTELKRKNLSDGNILKSLKPYPPGGLELESKRGLLKTTRFREGLNIVVEDNLARST